MTPSWFRNRSKRTKISEKSHRWRSSPLLRLEELEKREVPSFAFSANFNAGGSPFSPVLADFNHDGRLDLAVVGSNGPASFVSVLLGNGDGTFRGAQQFSVGNGPSGLAVGDINGDGHLDLVVANSQSGTVSILTGSGNGFFAPALSFSVGANPFAVAVADLTGNGKEDIVTTDPGTNQVSVLLNTSSGGTISFAAPMLFATGPGTYPASVAIADFNGDGKPDLAVTDKNMYQVGVLLGNGDGTFQSAQNWGAEQKPSSIVAADLNHDGNIDLAVTNSGGNTVSVLLGNGDGTFQATQNFAAGVKPSALVVADVNGVAQPSLVVTNPTTNSISVLLGNGNGTFLAPRFYAAGGLSPDDLAVGELNGDGQPDIITTNAVTSDVSVLLNTSAPLFQSPQTLIADAAPDSAALSDLNGDGLPDLAVANYDSKDVTVMLGDGTGGFAPGQNFAANSYPKSVTVADINGDGIPDIVVANANRGYVSVLFGNGDGTFQAPVTISTGLANSETVTVADLNGDNIPDLIVPDGGGSVAVLLGNGNSTFRSPMTFFAGPQPEQAAVVDFNSDGIPDLIVTGYFETTLLLGNGDGTFKPAQTILIGQQLHALAVGDFNGDGRQDVAVIDYSQSTVSVLLGNGDGTFQTPKVYPVALSPYAIALADVNGDGKSDLLVAGRNNNLTGAIKPGAVSVLLGDGTGNFLPAENVNTGPFPYSVTVADINLNDEPDLILANKRGDTISVLLSNAAKRLQVTAPSLVIAGKTATVTVTALDDQGRVDSRYNGTVSLTSTDPRFVPPPPYTFTPADMGSHAFRVSLMTAGPQSLSASDLEIAGTSNSISVQPAAPNHLVFLQQPIGSIVGTPIQPAVTVELLDPFNNLSKSTASVSLTASGPGSFTSTSATTVAAVAGLATFSNVALTASGSYMLGAISAGLTSAFSASFSIDPPTTRIWTGKAGADTHWTNPANWLEDVAPTAANDLFFPDGASNFKPNNDFTAGTMFNSINFTGTAGGYDLLGNAIGLTAGITGNAGIDQIDLAGIALDAAQIFHGANSTLLISSEVNLQGFNLTLDGSSTTTGNDVLGGIIIGSGGLAKNGSSTWTISGNNSYLGATTISAGTLAINNNNSLGSPVAGTKVMAGASLQVSNNLVLTEPLTLNGDGNNTSAGAINIRDIHGDDRFGQITLDSSSTILSANIGINTMTLPSAVQNNGFDLSIVGGGGYSTILTGNVTGAGHVFNFGSIFSGTGSLTGPLDINQGTLSPGVNGPGTLNSADVTLGIGTTYKPVFSGTGNSMLASTGSVSLAGANLDLSLQSGFVPNPGTSYVIITATGSINGNFNGLPDGSPVTVNGQQFVIRYINSGSTELGSSAVTSRTVLFPVPAATTTSMFATPNPVIAGQPETFTALVTSPAAAAAGVSSSVITGTVNFFDGPKLLGSAQVIGGAALFTTTSLAAGNHSVTATYAGSPDFSASNSNASPVSLAVNSNSVGWQHVLTGDFTGDGKTDIAGMTASGQWWVAVSNGSTFANQLWGTWNSNVTWLDVQTGDFNGDRKMDIVGRNAQTGEWNVAISNGSAFTTSVWGSWSANPAVTWVDVKVADFNGDGKSDITGRWLQTGQWWTSVSNGTSLNTTEWATWSAAVTWEDVKVGDFNGDGKSDIIGRFGAAGQWWTGASTGSAFTTSLWDTWAADSPNVTWVDVQVGDFNGDAMADITGRWLQSGQWWTSLSNGAGFTHTLWTTWNPNVTWVDVKVGDFNGDGKADIVGRWLQGGEWWTGQSTGAAFITSKWDMWSPVVSWVDVQVGDVNGDGLPDLVGRIQQNGQWWAGISNSSSFTNQLWTTWAV
jgi:autotransporter-associated beta strand protein